MTPHITRRDLLKIAGGSALGVIFSPLPWKLLDDSAIWTQNWSSIPKLAHAPFTSRYSACTLCSAGCALQARCAGTIPVALGGVAGHPLTSGSLCPIGLASHHMAHHPLRLAGPVRIAGKTGDARVEPVELDATVAGIGATLRAIAAGTDGGTVAVLDRQPGRALSLAYRSFLAGFPHGLYLVPANLEDETTNALRGMAAADPGPMGVDFTNVTTILSFGAPLLDGWGTPGAMMELFTEKRARGIRFLHVEPRPSRTALAADRWLRNRPGTERAIALGIARVLAEEKLIPAAALRAFPNPGVVLARLRDTDLNAVAAQSGIPAEEIAAVAREIGKGSSIIIAGSDPGGGPLPRETRSAIALLNLLVPPSPGIVLRNPMPDEPTLKGNMAMTLEEVPESSLRLLIIDSAESGYALPAGLLRRKMRRDGQIVALSPFLTPLAASADVIIPVAAPFEKIGEAPRPPSAPRASFSLALPLLPERPAGVDAYALLVRLADAAGLPLKSPATTEALLRRRSDAIHAGRRGRVFLPAGRSTIPLADIPSPDNLWEHLRAGGCWIDDTREQLRGTFTLPAKANAPAAPACAAGQVMLLPFGWKSATAAGLVSPLLSKLFQESGVRDCDGVALISPATAADHGLADGFGAVISTPRGKGNVRVQVDAAVLPGIVHAAVGPRPNGQESLSSPAGEGILSLCDVGDDGTWSITMAMIEKG
jgi:anaerobic selenocysteine-containing dehydrogenase